MSEADQAGKRITVREVAARAGVSVATVSRVLNDAYDAPPATRERVWRAVQDLDYHPTQVKTLTGLSDTIAVGIPLLESPFYMAIAAGIEEHARASGRAVLLSATANEPELELALIDMMRQRGVEAVILMGAVREDEAHRAALAQRAASIERTGSRLVFCGRPWRGPAEAPVYLVDYDAEEGAHALTNYLLSAGHRRIAHLGGPPHFTTVQRREAGYRRALAESDVPIDEDLVVPGEMTRPSGLELGRRILGESGITAVIAANDEMAAGVYAAARESGRTIPDDLSVVGFDDVPVARDLSPALTTLHVPQRDVGRAAARMALRRSTAADRRFEERRVVVGTHVMVRESVKRLSPL